MGVRRRALAASVLLAASVVACVVAAPSPAPTPFPEGVQVVVGRGEIGGTPWVATWWRSRNAFGDELCQRVRVGDRDLLGQSGDAAEPCWRAGHERDEVNSFWSVARDLDRPTVVSVLMGSQLQSARLSVDGETLEVPAVLLEPIGLDRAGFVHLLPPGAEFQGGEFINADGVVTDTFGP